MWPPISKRMAEKMRKANCSLVSGVRAAGSTSEARVFENWIQMAEDVLFSTDHQIVAAIQSIHATAGAGVDVMDALGFQVRARRMSS
jgi:hypothetical protein